MRGDAADARDELAQRFAGEGAVHARVIEFALEADHHRPAHGRGGNIRLGEHGDYVAGLKRQVVGGIAFEHRLAEIERKESGGEIGLVQPLDHRVVPVDLVGELAHVGRELALGNRFHTGRRVLPPVVVGRDQRFLFRDQVAHAQAFAPRVAQGLRDIAAQGDRVFEARRDRQDGNKIPVLDGPLQAVVVERKLIDAARFAIVDALEGSLPRLRGSGEAAGEVEELADVGRPFQLEDGAVVDAAGDCGERPHRREIDDVAGKERHVPGFVAGKQQIVEVELGDGAVAALELDRAHRAVPRGPARGEDSIHQRA